MLMDAAPEQLLLGSGHSLVDSLHGAGELRVVLDCSL
jgi:hypothetical protein